MAEKQSFMLSFLESFAAWIINILLKIIRTPPIWIIQENNSNFEDGTVGCRNISAKRTI